MSHSSGMQFPIGATVINSEAIRFVWAVGTRFVTAEFVERRTLRGIANLTGLGSKKPQVVPLAHKAWLSRDRRSALIEAGQICFEKALAEHGSGETRGSPARGRNAWTDDRNQSDHGLFNQCAATAQKR